jgi:hypothetical protein
MSINTNCALNTSKHFNTITQLLRQMNKSGHYAYVWISIFNNQQSASHTKNFGLSIFYYTCIFSHSCMENLTALHFPSGVTFPTPLYFAQVKNISPSGLNHNTVGTPYLLFYSLWLRDKKVLTTNKLDPSKLVPQSHGTILSVPVDLLLFSQEHLDSMKPEYNELWEGGEECVLLYLLKQISVTIIFLSDEQTAYIPSDTITSEWEHIQTAEEWLYLSFILNSKWMSCF